MLFMELCAEDATDPVVDGCWEVTVSELAVVGTVWELPVLDIVVGTVWELPVLDTPVEVGDTLSYDGFPALSNVMAGIPLEKPGGGFVLPEGGLIIPGPLTPEMRDPPPLGGQNQQDGPCGGKIGNPWESCVAFVTPAVEVGVAVPQLKAIIGKDVVDGLLPEELAETVALNPFPVLDELLLERMLLLGARDVILVVGTGRILLELVDVMLETGEIVLELGTPVERNTVEKLPTEILVFGEQT